LHLDLEKFKNSNLFPNVKTDYYFAQ